MKLPQIPYAMILTAMKETRDVLKPGESARIHVGINADNSWEIYPHVGYLVESNGEPDEWGNRSWTLPSVCDDWSDEEVERVLDRWTNKEFTEFYRFPPIVIVYPSEE